MRHHQRTTLLSLVKCTLAIIQLIALPLPSMAATPTLATSQGFTLALKSDGSISAWGRNDYGQLGNGQAAIRLTPALVPSIAGVKTVAAGGGFSLALRNDGTVWGWGGNDTGQLGDGTTQNRFRAIAVTGLSGSATTIAAGTNHSMVLKTDGTVWTFGSGKSGQLGTGSIDDHLVPIQITGLPGARALAAGDKHSLALATDGTVWAWGDNSASQLGTGTTTSSLIPVKISTLANIVAISTKGNFNLALDTSGRVWAWGYGGWGALGDGTKTDRSTPFIVSGLPTIASISTGYRISVASSANGSIWLWGSNEAGQFGDTRYAEQLSPAQVTALAGFKSLALGDRFALGLDAAGRVATWGQNDQGQLGVGDTADRSVPTLLAGQPKAAQLAAGLTHGIAVLGDGSVWAWGTNGNGELGEAMVSGSSIPAKVSGSANVTAIAAGRYHNLALTADGSVWGWGMNNNFQLADPTRRNALVPRQVPGLPPINAVTAGEDSSYALDKTGVLWSWGLSTSGSLAMDSTSTTGLPTARDGLLPTTGPNSTNTHIQGSSSGGVAIAVTGQSSLSSFAMSTPKAISALSSVTGIAAGIYYGLAVRSDGSLWSWGRNDFGQLGDGTSAAHSAPKAIGLTNAIAVAAGNFHSLALDRTGNVWSWGYNGVGQLGDGTRISRLIPAKLSIPANVVAISAGGNNSCALDGNGQIWVWGANDHGQLGIASSASSVALPGLVASLTSVRNISCGTSYAVATRTDGSVWAWGRNFDGELGDGTYAKRDKPVLVVNDTASGFLSLSGRVLDNSADPGQLLQIVGKTSAALGTRLTDRRVKGLAGDVYFTALLPSTSPIIPRHLQRDGNAGMIPVTFSRGGYKQTGPTVPADTNASGPINGDDSYTIYEKSAADPLAGSNAIICMGITAPGLSAKGQVLMRAIATGSEINGINQCPTVQTEATMRMYAGHTAGPLTARTIAATVDPSDEDRSQVRNLYSWAIAPDGTQYMQTATGWGLMSDPIQPVMTVMVPPTGAVNLQVLTAQDLSSLVGTLVYIGLGSSWEEVRSMNKAGHYYTVQ